jgi:hypothetical protein
MLALTRENQGCFPRDSCFASLAAWREGNWYLATRLVLTLHFPSPSTLLSLYMSLTHWSYTFCMPVDILTGRWFQPIDKETSWTCFIQHTKRKIERVRTNYRSINFRLCVPIQKHLCHIFFFWVHQSHPHIQLHAGNVTWAKHALFMDDHACFADGWHSAFLLNIVKRIHHHEWSWMATEIWKVQ